MAGGVRQSGVFLRGVAWFFPAGISFDPTETSGPDDSCADAVVRFLLARTRFSFVRTKRDWPRPFFRRMVMPNLIPNWIVWIPVSLAVFSFPFPLQIHVNGIVCTFWTLMCLQIGRRT